MLVPSFATQQARSRYLSHRVSRLVELDVSERE